MPLISFSSTDDIKTDFLALFANLMQDEHDSVRLLAVGAAVSLAKKLAKDDINTHIVPSILSVIKVSFVP